jgi:hypothetical protein
MVFREIINADGPGAKSCLGAPKRRFALRISLFFILKRLGEGVTIRRGSRRAP